jgi:hypothetical protein
VVLCAQGSLNEAIQTMNSSLRLARVSALAISLVCVSCGDPAATSNSAPLVVLDPDGPERSYTVGDAVFLTVVAQDPDRDPLKFSYTWVTSNQLTTIKQATFVPSGQLATFRWTPDTADVTQGEPLRLIFVVEDGRGGKTEREIRLNILPGNGLPRFESGANELYKTCCDKPLTFEVRVRDDDTDQVQLMMRDAPPGATFDQIDKKKGRFTWQPAGNMVDRRIYGVTFVADDRENPPVTQKVTIVIPTEGGTSGPVVDPGGNDLCAGEAVIDHDALAAQRKPTGQLTIEAKLGAGAAVYDQRVLFWTTEDPIKNPDAALNSEVMEAEGQVIRATIPNVAVLEGGSRTLYYKICLINSMAAQDDPKSILCAPTLNELFYGVNLYNDASAACVEDALDAVSAGNEDFGSAVEVSRGGWDAWKICGDSPDYHFVRVRPGQTVLLVASYSFGQAPNFELYDERKRNISPQLEAYDCTGLTLAELSAPAGSAGQTYYLKVTGEDKPYHLTAIETAAGAGCVDEAREPNDQAGQATPLTRGMTLSGGEICPDLGDSDIYAIDLVAGEQLEVTLNHPSNNANLDMTLFSPSQRGLISRSENGVAFTFSIGRDDEVLTHEARQCGTYYLLVFSNDAPAPYTVTPRVKAGACRDMDGYMCNHTQPQASIIARNTTHSLYLCGGGEDWFKFKPLGGEVLASVRSTGQASVQDMEFDLVNINGVVLKKGAVEGRERVINYTFPDNDFYFLRIKSRVESSYELLIIQ